MKLTHILFVGILIQFVATAANAENEGTVHVRLENRLDRPDDGYCLDILGTGRNLRVDLPLFAHNCKDGATPDSTVRYSSQGELMFPAANVCVTAFGVNNTVLPGTSVLLRPCQEQSPFFAATGLQNFDHTDSGQLRLRDSELCLAVGPESSATYSPLDRWRVLTLESCTTIVPEYSVWELVPLN